ncbi:MAG TPA: tetratricopeptide repeat protein [Steroidobacteraceae bacterium]|jgi:tetratricopeptide (TPR) repeat protein|nr:tetratricopeptide repeat protein [Steroidobacteraceae bacterium]
MAEGLLDGVLGGEEDRVDATEGGAEPLAAAIAANIANQSPEVAAKTAAFFEKQIEVLEVQKKNLEAEYEFFEDQRGPRLLALRLRTGFQLFFALFATVIGVGLAIVIYEAVQSRSVVIDPIDISPNVAADVPSGKIIAAGLLDVLTRIQTASRSNAEHRNLSNAWTNEISIDVPETGISIGQLERMLKTRFGHDQHIEGDLSKTPAGVALTVRGNGILPKTFTGAAAGLDNLVTQAGEYVYSQSQPGLWAAYLANNDRNEEAIRFARGAFTTVAPSERPYILNYWANAITGIGRPGAMSEALQLWREAVRLQPYFWTGYNNIMFGLAGIGDEEGVVQVAEQMKQVAGGRPGRAPENMYQNYDQIVWDLPAIRASNLADMESHSGVGTQGSATGAENLQIVLYDVQLHDVKAATLRLKTTLVDEKNLPDVAQMALDQALLAEETGELMAAAKQWDAYAVAYANPTISTANPQYICYAAVTYETTGQPAKADAALNAVGTLTFVDCYRFRGDVLDRRGDWAAAQEWYTKSVTLSPSSPAGYYSWGVALAKHGELDAAAAKLEDANRRGPHWADPLKAWGDVLSKQGRTKEALAKYDQALKFTPNWKQLWDAREALAKHKT